MSFFSQLQPFVEFISSIRKLENYLSFDMQFPSKWSIPKNMLEEGNVIAFNIKDPNLKGISFVSKIDDSNIDSIIEKINKVIRLNREREMKESLFKEMIDNLKTTFESNSLDKLQNLYFGFEENTILNLDNNEQFESEFECQRFLEMLSNDFLKIRRTDCLFISDNSSPQRKYLLDLLSKNGFDKNILYRKFTTHPRPK